jgi:hypothetical protein
MRMASRTILAETHVLGSLRGYGTVAASHGVASDESRELESFQFGDASTAERIARLESHAVMTGRALRSGRFAVSRMMPAGFDDAGRPTVEVITLLFEARDLGFVAGALERLASDTEFWRTARATVGDGARVEADDGGAADAARDPRVLRHFDLWRAALRDGAVGVVPESESATVLALAAALDLSDRARLRWGVGLLSLSAPVDLCSIAPGTSLHGARAALRPAAEGAWHCGEESEYAAFRASSGRAHLPSVAEIESQGRTRVLANEDAWRMPARGGGKRGADGAGVDDRRTRRLMPLAIGSAALSTIVLAFALTMWTRRENAAAVEVPVFAPSTSGGGAASYGLTDPLGGEMPKAPAVVEETKVEVVLEEKAEEPGDEAKAEPPKKTEESGNPSTDAAEGKPPTPSEDSPPSGTPAPDASPSPSSAPSVPNADGGSAESDPVAPPSGDPALDELRKLRDRLQRASLPSAGRDLAPEERRRQAEAAVREWILVMHQVNLLDRSRKREASEQEGWQDPARRGDPDVLLMIGSYSGFMKTVNAVSNFNGVPLCPALVCEWRGIVNLMIDRIEKAEAEPFVGRNWAKAVMDEIEKDVLGESQSSGFRERQRAWNEGLQKNLLTRSGLSEERDAITRWMEKNKVLLPAECTP